MYKRGQLTLFVVLGILLVSSAALLYYYRDQIFLSEWQREQAQSLVVPQEAEELHTEISNCVASVAHDGMTLLGQQGGYIVLPEDPIGKGSYNTFSNSLEILPDSDFQTAYWFYQAANGVDHSQVPTIEDMQNQLATYMDEHLAPCANNYDLFTQYNATASEISTDVQILDDKVLFTVHYPVHIALYDFTFDLDSFYVSEDVPLGSLYHAATDIMNKENSDYVFEDVSYDSLVLYQDKVPLSWADLSCDQKTWNVNDVETNLKNILAENILALKARGTNYKVSDSTDKNYFEKDLIDSSIPDTTSVNFFYSTDWPFSMQVYPTEGSTLKEDTLTGSPVTAFLSGLFCLHNYNFIYDIKYPVLVSLYDTKTDYRFQFASMAVLDNNQPRKNTLGTLDLPPVENTICSNAQTPLTVSVEEVADDGSLVNLDSAQVSFQCINNLCPLGTTQGTDTTFTVPSCVNGQVIAEKDGYQRSLTTVTTTEESSATVVLEKYANLTYDIQVVDANGNTREATSSDVLFITLTEKDTGYTTTVTYPSESDRILLIPGTYTLSGKLVSAVPFDIKIDPSSYTKCISSPKIGLGGIFGLGSDTSCTNVDVSGADLQSALAGGVDHTWLVDRSVLQDASHVTFYVTSPGVPSNPDQIADVNSYIDSGMGYKEPAFS